MAYRSRDRSRSISPVGASRFEKPYTLPNSPVDAVNPYANMAVTTKHHHRELSTSTWSETTDSSPVRDYSTAPTSAQQSPIDRRLPMMKEVDPWTQHDHHEHDHEQDPADQEEWFDHFEADEIYDEEGYGDDCPDQATLAAVQDIPLYTADGYKIPFGSLYQPATAVNQRQLFIFVRHFYCGACQAYTKAMTEGITMQDYFSIPMPTSIIVVGCGKAELIPFYKAVTGTNFPVFAEPSRQLYKKLGMVLSGKIGRQRPDYMKDISNHAWLAGQVKTMREGLRARKSMRKVSRMTQGFDLVGSNSTSSPRVSSSYSLGSSARHVDDGYEEYGDVAIRQQLGQSTAQDSETQLRAMALRKRDLVKGGNPFQIGGEFLFEDGEVIWCHRMRHYRDHVEVADIRRLLELDE